MRFRIYTVCSINLQILSRRSIGVAQIQRCFGRGRSIFSVVHRWQTMLCLARFSCAIETRSTQNRCS